MLFIDASNLYEKEKKQNVMKEEHIDRVLELYNNRESVFCKQQQYVKHDLCQSLANFIERFTFISSSIKALSSAERA